MAQSHRLLRTESADDDFQPLLPHAISLGSDRGCNELFSQVCFIVRTGK
jgi:hypothetical protein